MNEQENLKEITDVCRREALDLPVVKNMHELQLALESAIAQLIAMHFDRLINILYRLDVSEKKVREGLAKTDQRTESTIAKLIIERQLTKISSRQLFSGPNTNIPDEEKW